MVPSSPTATDSLAAPEVRSKTIKEGSPGTTVTRNVSTTPPVAAGAVWVTVKLYVPANFKGSRSNVNDPSSATVSYAATVPFSGLAPTAIRVAFAVDAHSTTTEYAAPSSPPTALRAPSTGTTTSAVAAFAARSGRVAVPSTSDTSACAGPVLMTTEGMHVVADESREALNATHTGTPPSVAVTSYVPARGSVAVARCPYPAFRASSTRAAEAVTTSPAPARLETAVLVNFTRSSTSSWSISATFPYASRKSKSIASSTPASNVVIFVAAVHAPSWSSAAGGAPAPPS